MTDLVANSITLRRVAALSILALLLFLAAPFLLWPFAAFGERAEAIETETALLDRIGRLEARRASVASLATLATPPFIAAADAGGALAALQTRLAGVVPLEKLQIESLSPLPREEKPGAPVELSLTFSATESGLYDFLADLETRPPFVRVRELSLKSARDDRGVTVLGGNAVVSAVPLLGVQP